MGSKGSNLLEKKIAYFKLSVLCYSVVEHSSHSPTLILGSFVLAIPSEVREVEAEVSDLYSVLCIALRACYDILTAAHRRQFYIHHTHKEMRAEEGDLLLTVASAPHSYSPLLSLCPRSLHSVPPHLLPVPQPSMPHPHAPSSLKSFVLASPSAWITLPLGNPIKLLG